jgi:hypothetical protein
MWALESWARTGTKNSLCDKALKCLDYRVCLCNTGFYGINPAGGVYCPRNGMQSKEKIRRKMFPKFKPNDAAGILHWNSEQFEGSFFLLTKTISGCTLSSWQDK